MLYSATLLAPIPFGFERIGIIAFLATASCACAYLASSRFKQLPRTERLPFKQILIKPPFIVWITVVVIISVQLANGLYIDYLANK